MTNEKPLLVFPEFVEADRERKKSGFRKIHLPDHESQKKRLIPVLQSLQSLIIQPSPDSITPEYSLVFETIGDPSSFLIAIRHLNKDSSEIEFLLELPDGEIESFDDFYFEDNKGNKIANRQIPQKVFCVMANSKAIERMLSIWNSYSQDPSFKFPRGLTGLRDVFKHLRNIRRWNIHDRIEETGLIEKWKDDLELTSNNPVICEINLFYRNNKDRREESQKKVIDEILKMGGTIHKISCIPEIRYHALLLSIPRLSAEKILKFDESIQLLKIDSIMYVKPTGQAFIKNPTTSCSVDVKTEESSHIHSNPIIALFDGLPQENHPLLKKYLLIDDPDNYTKDYIVNDRKHGTSMASLIVYGDMNNSSHTIDRRIYVRPIMKPYKTPSGSSEGVPDDILIVDYIHNAVRRLFEKEAGEVAPNIKVINLSICIRSEMFFYQVSPLARLLDWLSYKYKILFIISVGNHTQDIELDMNTNQFRILPADDKNNEIIRALSRNIRNQRLLSPSESINSLSIGSLFKDNSNSNPPNNRIYQPCDERCPSPYSAFGMGINKSVKPDMIFNGGKNFIIEDIVNTNKIHWRTTSNQPPGILSIYPSISLQNKFSYSFTCGTSNSTALLSHEANRCFSTLDNILDFSNNVALFNKYSALLIKAMLVHSAQWGISSDIICQALGYRGRGSDDVHRWLGYGIPSFNYIHFCTSNNISLIGFGDLENDKAHRFHLPIPIDFHKKRISRELILTLAYFSPIAAQCQKYRISQVWASIENHKKIFPKRNEISDRAALRGTVQHEIFSGENISSWDKNDYLDIKINCRDVIPNKHKHKINYAFFVTLNINSRINIDLYQEIINKLHVKVPTRVIPI